MDYLLGSLYVTRCYETLDAAHDNNNNTSNSLNQSAQDASLGVGAGLVENMSSPLDQSDLMDSPGDIFTARRSTAKPSRIDRPTISVTNTQAMTVTATTTSSERTPKSSQTEDGRDSAAGGAMSMSPGSGGSGRTTPLAGAPFASELLSPRSAESSPMRTALPVLRHAAPVEYSVPVCDMEGKYILLYLAPPNEPHSGGCGGGAIEGQPSSTEAGADTLESLAGPESSSQAATRRSRTDGPPNPISAVALWKTQQQMQFQQQRSPYASASLAASPNAAKSLPTRRQGSPPRPVNPNSAMRPHNRAPRASPLALPADKLLLLFYGLLMQQLREAELSLGAAAMDAALPTAAAATAMATGPTANPRRATLAEGSTSPASPEPPTTTAAASTSVPAVLATMGAIGALVEAPIAVLELRYVPLTGANTDDGTLTADDAQLGVTVGRTGTHSLSPAVTSNASSPSLHPSANGPSSLVPTSLSLGTASRASSTHLTVPRSVGQTLSPNGQVSPLMPPLRHNSGAPRTSSPLPAGLMPSSASAVSRAAAANGLGVNSTAGLPRGASVATTAGPSSSGLVRYQNGSNNSAHAAAGAHLGHGAALAKPLSDTVNLVLDSSPAADLEQVYFDRRITDCSFYGGWYALRNGDAYRRVIDMYGLTSWPAVLLLDPAGNIVCFQALEHIERELGQYYYARYMKLRPKLPPPLMAIAPSTAAAALVHPIGSATSSAAASPRMDSAAAVAPAAVANTEDTPLATTPAAMHTAAPTTSPPSPAMGATGGHTDASTTAFGPPTSPLSVDEESPASSNASSSALRRCPTTTTTANFESSARSPDGGPSSPFGSGPTDGDPFTRGRDDDLSGTASPVRGDRHGGESSASGPSGGCPRSSPTETVAMTTTGSNESPSWGSPTLMGEEDTSHSGSGPITPGATTGKGALPHTLCTPQALLGAHAVTNETQIFTAPADAHAAFGSASSPLSQPHSTAALLDASHSVGSHTEAGDNASFTSGTLLPSGATITPPPSTTATSRVEVPDLSISPKPLAAPLELPHERSLTQSPLPASGALFHEASPGHVELSGELLSVPVAALENSSGTEISGIGATSSTTTDPALQDGSGDGSRPDSMLIGVPGMTAAALTRTPTARGPTVRFQSAFPWCPTAPTRAHTATTMTTAESHAEDATGDSAFTDEMSAAALAPARPSLQPLLRRALVLAKSAGEIASGMDDAPRREEELPGAEAAHLVLVFGAHWHPAVSRVLKAVTKLTACVNGSAAGAGTRPKLDMDAEELDGGGLFSNGLRGLSGGGLSGGFFMSGGVGGGGGSGDLNDGTVDSLDELDGGGFTGAPVALDARALPTLRTGDEDEDDAGATPRPTSALPGSAPRAQVLYICTDDTAEELRASVRGIPESWRCLSPALPDNATAEATSLGADLETTSSANDSRVLPESPSKAALMSPPFSPSATARNANLRRPAAATTSHWSTMSASDITTWLMGCFNVTALPRVVVLERYPSPESVAETALHDDTTTTTTTTTMTAGEQKACVTWRPVQLHAESVKLFQDPTGTDFPWPDPNVLFSGDGPGDVDSDPHSTQCGEITDREAGEDDEAPGDDAWFGSLGRRSWMSPRSPAHPYYSPSPGWHPNSCENSVSRLMAWYSGCPDAADGDEDAENTNEGRMPLSSTARARRRVAARTSPTPPPADSAEGAASDAAAAAAVEAAAEAEEAAAAREDPLYLPDWTRYVVPPMAPFTLEVAKKVRRTTAAAAKGTPLDGIEATPLTEHSADMYPTEPPSTALPSALLGPPPTHAAFEEADVETVQVPSELPVRLRRGGFFLVLCAFGPVEASLHNDCLNAMQEARTWLADVLGERKRKSWEAAQRTRDLLLLSLPARLGATALCSGTENFSPRGSVGTTWLPTVSGSTAGPTATALASFLSNEDNRSGASPPPPFTSAASERSLNSTYVLNDVHRALLQQAPAEYDGERGVASGGTTLPLVYFYDAVFPNPRLQATRHHTPELVLDHTRAARDAHADDLAFLQEHILANIVEQDESQLPPREGEIFLACVRLPQKFAAVLRRRLPSEAPATAATAPPSASPGLSTVPSAPTPAPPSTTNFASPSPSTASTGATHALDAASRLPSTSASASASASAGRAGSQSGPSAGPPTASTTPASGSETRHASLSLEGTEMAVDGPHSGSPSLAATLRKELSPDPDQHPVSSAAAVKQFLYDQIVQGLLDS